MEISSFGLRARGGGSGLAFKRFKGLGLSVDPKIGVGGM